MKRTAIITVLFLALSFGSYAQDAFIGEVRLFAGNFAPRGWAFCDGQLLPISQNTALFSLLGTTYGGDGRTTFGLPDLRGKYVLGEGNGPGMTPVSWGQIFRQDVDTRGKTGQAASRDLKKQGALGMHYIICLQGIYPSRN